MKIDRVTLTGADNTIDPQALHPLTEEFPFVEWGILLSKSSEGQNRFPTTEWICKLVDGYEHRKYPPRLSGHLCGRWVRDICDGNWSFIQDKPEFCGYFTRFQLNFHAYLHRLKDTDAFIRGFEQPAKYTPHCEEFIFQLDGVNDELVNIAREGGINAVPLFDISGGRGVLPESWPKPLEGVYQGYAGGLGPENLKEQIQLIENVVGDRTIWIDMETRIRNDQDVFDLDLCRKCLEIASEWVDG